MPMTEEILSLRGIHKAAALLIMLGPDASAKIIKKLSEDQIEAISQAIVDLGPVTQEIRGQVMGEFSQMLASARGRRAGGVTFAQDVLEKSVGAERAKQIITKLGPRRTKAPFDFVRRTDPAQLMNSIQAEHPQTIALVLAHLEPSQSAVVLASLPKEQQIEVVRRIATMDKTQPDVVKEVEDVIAKRISSVSSEELTLSGGAKAVAEVLNRADRSTEKNILQVLEGENPGLVDEIKKLMFVFEDIVLVDDRGIQQVLREADPKELALALKTASDEVKEKIFRNMSKRAAEGIKEDMGFLGPVRLRQVEEAQQKVVSIIRKLEEKGEIVIKGRGTKEDALVE